MAAFLNTPSDFASVSPGSHALHQPVILLPPSEFEKPKVKTNDVWQDFKKATEEIMSLRMENQKLRDAFDKLSTPEQASVPANMHSHNFATEERRYADELIARQAEEITKLKCTVHVLEQEKQTLQNSCEQKIALLEREKEESEIALRDGLRRREDHYEQQVYRLSQEHEGEMEDLQARIAHLSGELEHVKTELSSQVINLTQELEAMRKQTSSTEGEHQQELREKDSLVQKLTLQVQQLKTYITESEQLHKPQQIWHQECETLNNKIKILEAEKETLTSSAKLMDVRLNSIKEILNTQEAELSKAKEETIDKNKIKELLLTRWRQKVYALLIQQKSSEIVSRKDLQNWKEKTSKLEDQMDSLHNTISILQHTLTAREAELQMSINRTKTLQEELHRAQQVISKLENESLQNGEIVEQLAVIAGSFEDGFEERIHIVQQAMTQLKSFNQRISFASSRMEILKSQIVRRESLKIMEKDEETSKAVADVEAKEDWSLEREQLNQELKHVLQERDMLAAQLTKDSEAWTEKLVSIRAQGKADIDQLNHIIKDLEIANHDKLEKLEKMTAAFEASQRDLQETTERVEELRTNLARHQHTMQEALECQRKELEAEWTEQFAEMERKLNDARREHAKAVVALRQLERQSAREKERNQELQATTESHFQMQLSHLQKHLTTVESERNLFMATLRQEGLLGRIRSERGEPVRIDFQENDVALSSHPVKIIKESESKEVLNESMAMILEDLKSLAPAVLNDSEDSLDENM